MSILRIYRGQALQNALSEIVAPVEVTYWAIDTPEADTLNALDELAALTSYLSVTIHSGQPGQADRVVVQGQRGGEMVFAGAPIGTELAALVSAIVVAGRGDSGLSMPVRERLAGLDRPVHLEVFTTPT